MKISFSIASAWWDGKRDEALAMLNGDEYNYDLRTEKAFSYGQGFHKAMEMESDVTGKIPAIFGLPEFDVVATEKKLYSTLPSGDILSGVIDVVAVNRKQNIVMMGDYKSGKTYKDMQAYFYHVLVLHHPWWRETFGSVDPTHFFFFTLDKQENETYTDIIQLSYPQTRAEWEDPIGTTYTAGLNMVMTIIDDIKGTLGIEN